MKWPLFLAACLALLVALTVRWFWPSDRVPVPTVELPDARFDYILTDFSARFTDAAGQVELLVSGPRLEHDSATRIATLDQPRFHFEPAGANWTGRSELGRFERDEEELVLENDVVLTQPLDVGELVVQTQALHHHRLARTISASTPVEIHRPGTWLRAGGLKITLDQDLIELSNHVQVQIQTVDAAGHRDGNDADQLQPGG